MHLPVSHSCQTHATVKPLYGIVSDSILFYGLQRSPYITIAAGVGIVSFATLAGFELSLIIAALCLFGGNLSVSSPDVMIDAIVAQQCRYFPKFASVTSIVTVSPFLSLSFVCHYCSCLYRTCKRSAGEHSPCVAFLVSVHQVRM